MNNDPHAKSMLKRIARCALMMLAATAPASAQTDLRGPIDRLLADSTAARSHAGVRVIDTAGTNVLYSLRAGETFTPASNMKLLTTAAALGQLGPDFSFVTLFGTRADDLCVLASGDPGLGDPRLADRRKQKIDAVFAKLAKALKQRGLTRIDGDLVVDDTVFDREFFHPHWPADQRDRWYAAEVAGFNFNDNCIDIRLAPAKKGDGVQAELTPATDYVKLVNRAKRDPKTHLVWFRRVELSNTFVAGGKVKERMWSPVSVPVHDPPAFAARVLRETLKREGVTIAGKTRFERVRQRDGSPPADLRVLLRHEQGIGECLWRCNTHSQNFFAEALFKALGAYRGSSPRPRQVGSFKRGQAAVADFIKRSGLPAPKGLAIDDGSGLSKANRLSPELITELLRQMAGGESAEMWYDSLATGGVDGTLRKRFKQFNGEPVVLAKTGTLSNAVALSGYVQTADKRLLAFSILFDGVPGGGVWKVRHVADGIVSLLANLGRPSKDDS